MKFDLSQIEFSKKDLQKHIHFPQRLTSELAEIIGLHIGDGHLGYRKDRKSYILQLMGNPKTEKEHYDNHISQLWKTVFNIHLKLKNHPNGCYGFQFYSKAIGTFFNRVLKMPIGKKSKTIRIPDLLKETCKNGISAETISCIRGIIDTDFYVNKDRGQIELGAWFASRNLVLDLQKYLELISIQPKLQLDVEYYNSSAKRYLIRHRIRVRKKEDLLRYLRMIGSNNPKIYNKFNNLNEP